MEHCQICSTEILTNFHSRFIDTSLLLLLLNQMLLSCTCNITRTVRSVTEYYKNCQTELTRSIYGTIALDSIESNMTVNNLEKEMREMFRGTLSSLTNLNVNQGVVYDR